MIIDEWAAAWGINQNAVNDLKLRMLGGSPDVVSPLPGDPASEAAAQTAVRLEASRVGGRLWRNNTGVLFADDGTPVRFGLANDSKAMNQKIKSSDLIGLVPFQIRERHVGLLIGRFVAREIKRPGWQYRGTPREAAQLEFLSLVSAMGGDARFATGEGTL